MMKNLFLFLFSYILVASQQDIHSKDYKLFVTLHNAPFDSLYLFDRTEGSNKYFIGEKTDSFTWKITVPDSVAENSTRMVLKPSNCAYLNNTATEICFFPDDKKKGQISNIGFEDRNNEIYATYMKRSITYNDYFIARIGNIDSVMLGDYISEKFKLILKDDKSDITVRAKDPYFGRFFDVDNKKVTYDEYMKRHIKLSEKYPDSRYLIFELAQNIYKFKSKEDIKSIYVNLSNKHKQSLWAKKIERYLSASKTDKFRNLSLPTSDKVTCEYIIQDTTKYNLVTFTASWCGYCHEAIPILKKINEELNKNLILTYISMDEEQKIPAFQNIILDKDIRWRTLFAFKDLRGIYDEYFTQGIPHSILVSPNGEMEEIEVRDEKQLKKLYSLCKDN